MIFFVCIIINITTVQIISVLYSHQKGQDHRAFPACIAMKIGKRNMHVWKVNKLATGTREIFS